MAPSPSPKASCEPAAPSPSRYSSEYGTRNVAPQVDDLPDRQRPLFLCELDTLARPPQE